MRGKKINNEFVFSFILESVQNGIVDASNIRMKAEDLIREIDKKIKEAALLKKTRSKLLDVLETLDKKDSLTEDKIFLSFFSIKNFGIARVIFDNAIKGLSVLNEDEREIFSSMEKLKIFEIQNGIIKSGNNYLLFKKFLEMLDEYR